MNHPTGTFHLNLLSFRQQSAWSFGRLEDDCQKFVNFFKMSVSEYENLKQLLLTETERKNVL
jgi:hypothetical protein